ncbi:MAG: YjgP/YjgQ family permease [Thermodesulfobacteria bacterium]|nr:YjgP/YjgQ family permease [Thermodesulfobacteriota bacterium]
MILTRYLSQEISRSFLASFLALNVLLLISRLVTLLVDLANEQLRAFDYFRLVLFLAPYFLTFTLPLSALLAVILVFMRLSQDQELLAFESLGIPFVRLLTPVVALGLVTLCLTYLVTIRYLPWSKRAFRTFLFELTERKIARGIPAKTFVNWLPGLSIFVEEAWREGRSFALVFIVDDTDPRKRGLIFAKRGELEHTDGTLVFRLYHGSIHVVNRDYTQAEELSFEEYVYRLDAAKLEKSRRRSRGEMTLEELKKRALSYPPGHEKRIYYLLEYYQRLTFPWAAFLLPLIAAPLGASIRASGRGVGLALAAGLFLGYYFLQSGASSLAQKGWLSPAVALVLPNVILALIAAILIWAAQKGKIGIGR